MDHKRETDEEIEANRVIEYYKKYCQNPDLIKYFTGPEASCVEKKVFNVDIHKKVPLRNQQPVILSENVDVQANQESVNEEQCNSSRTIKSPTPLDIVSEHEDTEEKNHSCSSSVASNKIEWDNGADIGYKNSYQFLSARKSASFPSLLTQNVSVNSRVLPKEAAEKSISENIQELRKMYHQLTFSSETSSSVNKGYTASSESKGQSSSSPQENKNMKISTKSSSSSDSYLHRKIGHPVAYSTPHEESTSKESIPGSSKDVKSSKKHFSESSRESTSKSSTKPGVYSVTPMLTLSAKPKRNLNNDELFIPTEKESIVDHNVISSAEQVRESNLNVIKPETAKNSNHYRKKIHLCLTKPISVECISLENKNNVHKDVQTSFSSDKSSKCVQTEEVDLKSAVFDSKIRCSPQTQNIEYIRFGEETSRGASSKLYPTRDSARNTYISSEEKNCRATQTEIVCSKNTKTKRVPKEAIDEKMTEFTQEKRVSDKKMYTVSSETSSVNTMSQEKESSNENLESKEGCYKSADNTNEFQAEEMLLAEMISLNYSKNLNTDIKRSINILQKLLRSRKYDNSTKKYYIKKIVQKIVDSKYSDDSTSSDLFMPKKKTVEPRSVKETKSETEKPKSSTKLMDNLPWYPISEPIYSVPKNNSKKLVSRSDKKVTEDNNLKPRKSEKKTIAPNVTNENRRFIPPVQKDQVEIPEAKVDKIKVPLISPEDIHRSNNSATTTEDLKINQKYARPEKTAKLASKSSSKLTYNPVPQKDYRPISSEGKIGETNWRTAKTLSEKLLENRDLIDFKNGQGDYLLHVVKNERNHQLSWINNEIEHLVKLKELLEKKPEKTRPDSKLKDVISSLLKMKENDMKVQSRSPLQELQDARREYKRSEGSSRDLQTQDEVPSMPSTSPPKSAQPFPGNNKPNVQVYSCTTENQAYSNPDQEYSEQKKCTCGPGTCKCCQTATHEEKVIQCPAFRQCTCQTEPKEDANIQCNCKEHAGVSCNCDEVCQDKDNACKCKTSSSSSSSSSGSDSHMSCICCKKEKILKNLISKIPLCGPCQEVHRTNFYPHNYCDPNHSCICYNLVNRDLLCQFKQTLSELERLDIYQQYCEVLKNCKCCKKCGCKCKLPTKFKNGCAYFLKLEDACPNKHCEEEECDSDFFNCEEEEEEDRENYLPEVTVKVPNPRCSCSRKKKNGHEAKKYTSCPSIQNYLCTLKPDFIARAERRRRILRDATTQREENSEKRKLNFIEKVNYLNQRKRNDKVSSESNIYKQNGYQTNTYCVFDIELNDSPKRVQPRVFKSFREMKDLTRRRYLHLTEVKSKKKLNREKRLREANRLLANTFTRRLQRSTLRGNVDIPLNVKVVAY